MDISRLDNAQVQNTRVILRSDLHLIYDPAGQPTRDLYLSRILPSLRLLLDRGARVLLTGHRNPGQSFSDLTDHFSRLLEHEVSFLANPFESGSEKTLQDSGPGSLFLAENLRNWENEEKNTESAARPLARMGDLFINDAFDASREKFSSIATLPLLLPSVAGNQFNREIQVFRDLLQGKENPLVLILGGVSFQEKSRFLRSLLQAPRVRLQSILVGGGAAFTFMKSRAIPVGQSLVDQSREVEAFQLIEKSELVETEFLLPADHLIADEYSPSARTKTVKQNDIPDRWMGMDIGPRTVSLFEKSMKKGNTIIWYGPPGVVEHEKYRKGSLLLARSLTRMKNRSIILGEKTVELLASAGLLEKCTHWSTSSKSALALLTGAELPGLSALEKSSPTEE